MGVQAKTGPYNTLFLTIGLFFPESLPSIGLFVQCACSYCCSQTNEHYFIYIYIYYFLQPLIFVYNNNITLLTAKLYNFQSLRVRDKFTNTITRSLINYSYIQFTIILGKKQKHHNHIFVQTTNVWCGETTSEKNHISIRF